MKHALEGFKVKLEQTEESADLKIRQEKLLRQRTEKRNLEQKQTEPKAATGHHKIGQPTHCGGVEVESGGRERKG